MPLRSHATARQVRLGTELRRLREAAGLKARELAALLHSTSAQISQMELGFAGVSEERVRRLAAHCACTDEALIDALVTMATDRTRGWWEEYRGVLPPVFMDSAEAEHHATYLREIVITRVPGLLQTPDYARAVFAYMNPELPASELDPRVEHRMRRRTVIEGARPTPYEAIIHEVALRLRVSTRESMRVQLQQILDLIEKRQATVRVIPIDRDGFAGSGASMTYVGGPLPRLDTVLRDSPTGVAFIDAESQLDRLRGLFRRVEDAALDATASRDFIYRLAKEL
ncbi:helix-turn-helix domain-containing protein [Streptomyces sp. 15-116A]|uniref:helix-turn-helix domain-containing protein n=1 Tax=Streptomyces sp. 15-116A TaxID=2259035 RepID=UPI0021B2E941|nr:helix-turn-helix transcriptional regulator [Streptomyces sp. 15-116A]MCT7351232.1 helix-turn-helix domain-containing protein [Streptomyces sp. 15-116A]